MSYTLSIVLLIRQATILVLFIHINEGSDAVLPFQCSDRGADVVQEELPLKGTLVYPSLIANVSSSTGTQAFNTLNASSGLHLKEIVVRLFTWASGHGHVLRLTLNEELLSKGLKTAATGRPLLTGQEACFYQGTCVSPSHESEDSYAAVSTCNGLRGIFYTNGETYSIRPVGNRRSSGGGIDGCWPHVLFRVSQLVNLDNAPVADTPVDGSATSRLSCGIQGSSRGGAAGARWMPFEGLHPSEYYGRMTGNGRSQVETDQKAAEIKSITLAVVADRAFFAQKNATEDDVVQYLLAVVNIADLYYRPLGVAIALAYCQIWRNRNDIPVPTNVRETLHNLLAHTQGRMKDYSISALITGQPFAGGLYGLAVPDSVCTQRAVAVASDSRAGTGEPHALASVLVHLIGHILGLQHDGNGCACSDEAGCIMKDTRSAAKGEPRKFSTCSASRTDTLNMVELGACLLRGKKPPTYQQFCGNGVIERGEQCDCGPPGKCEQVDPCCDASTCLLKPWATCRAGPCCENCKPRTPATICRPAENECDIPEYCDGVSNECPSNLVVQDGQPCASQSALCFAGQCHSRQDQCESYWGKGATAASGECYASLNMLGSVNGHCGQTDDGLDGLTYRKCAVKDVLCGLLQCSGGSEQPVQDRFIPNQVTTDGQQQMCKSVGIHPHLPATAGRMVGLVTDGTLCGEDHVCLSQACVPVSALVTRRCPRDLDNNRTCSGKGVCTNIGTCFCKKGYSGLDCSVELNITANSNLDGVMPSAVSEKAAKDGQSPDDEVLAASLDVKWLVVISVTIAVAVVATTLTTIFCLRRRRGIKSAQKAAQHVAISLNGKHGSIAMLSLSKNESPSVRASRNTPTSSRQSFSSDDESEEDDADVEAASALVSGGGLAGGSLLKIPEELFRQPARGILKKTSSRLRDRDEVLSSETCSCSDSDDDDTTSWDGTDREGPPLVYSLPRRLKNVDNGGNQTASLAATEGAADGADAALCERATAAASLMSPVSVQVVLPCRLWQGSPLAHRSLVVSTLNEDSGNGTEASPGTSDDFGVARGSVQTFATLEPYRSRGRSQPIPVPPPAIDTGRGMADGGCDADNAHGECRLSNAVCAAAAEAGLTPTVADASREPSSIGIADCSTANHEGLPVGKAEVIGLGPGRPRTHSRGEFVKQPSLRTFMPVAGKAGDEEPVAGRNCTGWPVQGPQFTLPAMHVVNGNADSAPAKKRPNMLDLRATIDCADV